MADLIIAVKGSITDNNFPAVKDELVKKINAINTDLITDQDFAEADTTAKSLRDAVKGLSSAKEDALSQMEDVFNLFNQVDELSETARKKALELEKLIKQKTDERKKELISAAHEKIHSFEPKNKDYYLLYNNEDFVGRLSDVVKGKRSFVSIEKALDDEVNLIISEAEEKAGKMAKSAEFLDERAEEYPALFNDRKQLLLMEYDAMVAVMESRITAHKATMAKEAAEAEAEESKKAVQQNNEQPSVPKISISDPSEPVENYDIFFSVRGKKSEIEHIAKSIRFQFESAGVGFVKGRVVKSKVKNNAE